MKKLSIFLTLMLTVIIACSNFACAGSQILTFSAFNTNIRIEARDKNISSKTQDELKALFSNLEKDFDLNDQNSILSKLNNSLANQNFELNERQKEVFNLSKKYYNFTDGKFNPAIFPLVKLWGFDNFSLTVDYSKPTKEQIRAELEKVDFDSLNINENYITKSKDEVQIDLGGLVKGYAVDKALETLLNDGHKAGYINIGNSSMALLNVESLDVAHPRKSEQSILTINTKEKLNLTLSTSGDYERFFEIDNERYSHIINPKTGEPIKGGVASATVIGGTGAFTDAITTALCVCDNENELVSLMQKIIDEYPNVELYIVYEKDGIKQILTNKKQGENFTLLDDEYQIKNI